MKKDIETRYQNTSSHKIRKWEREWQILTFRKIESILASSVSPCCGLRDGGTQRRLAGGTGFSLPVARDSVPVCLGSSVLKVGEAPAVGYALRNPTDGGTATLSIFPGMVEEEN